MAKAKKTSVNNTINIKSLPVQCNIGASKFVNDDWGTIAFSIPRNQIQNKFTTAELRYNFIYFSISLVLKIPNKAIIDLIKQSPKLL